MKKKTKSVKAKVTKGKKATTRKNTPAIPVRLFRIDKAAIAKASHHGFVLGWPKGKGVLELFNAIGGSCREFRITAVVKTTVKESYPYVFVTNGAGAKFEVVQDHDPVV